MEVPASSAAVNAVWLLVACFLVLLEGTFTTNGKLATVVFVITLTHIPPLPTQPTYLTVSFLDNKKSSHTSDFVLHDDVTMFSHDR